MLAFALKQLMLANVDKAVDISGGATVGTRLPFARKSYLHPVIHPGRNRHVKLDDVPHKALPAASRTWVGIAWALRRVDALSAPSGICHSRGSDPVGGVSRRRALAHEPKVRFAVLGAALRSFGAQRHGCGSFIGGPWDRLTSRRVQCR